MDEARRRQAAARRRGLAILAVSGLFFAFAPARGDGLPALDRWHFRQPVETLHVTDAEDLQRLFAAQDFWLAAIEKHRIVPRTYLHRLVDDIHAVAPVRAREQLFIRIVLPLIVRANTEVLAQRALLEQIAADRTPGSAVSRKHRRWLQAVAERYGGKPTDLNGLLHRVDAIPPSLAIAQAIDESGWGTAPLARQSNGLFGEHAPPGTGRGRLHVQGANVNVAAFPSLLDGVLAYVTNLNRHSAYEKLRALRASLRAGGKTVSGHALAEGLAEYSARGMSYVDTLRNLIETHRLAAFDAARLDRRGRTVMIRTAR